MRRFKLSKAHLERVLQERGYSSLAAFCEQTKINRATIYHYMQGRGPLADAYYSLCDQLQVDPLSLLEEEKVSSDVDVSEIRAIVEALCKRDCELAVGLFGSRAKGTARRFSDWDLGITRGVGGLGTREYFVLKQRVDDLSDNLARKVDVINLDAAPLWFLSGINYQPIFLLGNRNAWSYFMGVLDGIQKAA